MRIIVFAAAVAAGALCFGVAANAADDPAPAKPTAHATDDGKKKDDGDRMICKSPEVTGSRLGAKKICRTKREWDEITEQSRHLMDDNHQTNPRG